jgi:hypothetical protein
MDSKENSICRGILVSRKSIEMLLGLRFVSLVTCRSRLAHVR